MRISIRRKLILTFTTCALLGILYFVSVVEEQVKPRYREALEEPLVDLAYALAGTVSYSGEQLHFEPVQQALKKLKTQKLNATIYKLQKKAVDIRVYITDAKGIVQFYSDNSSLVGSDFSTWNDVTKTLRGEYGARASKDNVEDPDSTVLYVAAPIIAEGKIQGVLSIGKPARHNNRFIRQAKTNLILYSVLIALGVLFFSWLISTWVSSPLAKLQNYLRELKQGNEPTLPQFGENEIGELATLFLQMKLKLEGRDYVEQYVESVTHELKSPIASIQGSSELLQQYADNDPAKKLVKNIATESSRMESLVHNLLKLSELENSVTKIAKEKISASSLVEEVLESHHRLFEKRAITIDKQIQPNCFIEAERTLIFLLLSNLITNAAEFSKNSSTITVSCTQHNSQVEITVTDQGAGIAPWAQDKIFDRFFSLPRPNTGRKSSGLGLSLARAIAKLHGGECSLVKSNTKGTSFRLRI